MIGYEHLLTILTPYLSPETEILAPGTATTRYASPSNTLSTIPSSTNQPYLNATPLVAGGLARTISATVISPMELFRTRLQALPARESLAHLRCNR
jgi:solute carrier family 25 protein 39/40